jgi:hypothetical protein
VFRRWLEIGCAAERRVWRFNPHTINESLLVDKQDQGVYRSDDAFFPQGILELIGNLLCGQFSVSLIEALLLLAARVWLFVKLINATTRLPARYSFPNDLNEFLIGTSTFSFYVYRIKILFKNYLLNTIGIFLMYRLSEAT